MIIEGLTSTLSGGLQNRDEASVLPCRGCISQPMARWSPAHLPT